MSQELVESPLYSPDPDDRLRIALLYAGALRPVFWFSVARDGSIYLGPRYTEIRQLRHGEAVRSEGQQFHVAYGDGKEISDPEIRRKAKLSFHASGIINTPSGRFSGTSLRSITDQELLCSFVLQHPGAFEPVTGGAVRKRDICLRYPVDESRPLWGHFYVAPKEKVQLVTSRSAVFQTNPLFAYSGLQGVPDLVLQLVLGHGAQGPWSPQTYLLFPAVGPSSA